MQCFLKQQRKSQLPPATLRNAQLAGIGEVTGSIAPGKSADFIVTRENPLEDLWTLQHLELVVCCGRAVKIPSPKRRKEVDALLPSTSPKRALTYPPSDLRRSLIGNYGGISAVVP